MKFHGRIIFRRKPTDMKYYMCFRICKVYHIMYDKLHHIRNGQRSLALYKESAQLNYLMPHLSNDNIG